MGGAVGGRWEGRRQRGLIVKGRSQPLEALGTKVAVARTLTPGSGVCRHGRGRAGVGAGWRGDTKKGRVQGTATGCPERWRDPAFLCRGRGRSQQTRLQRKEETLGCLGRAGGGHWALVEREEAKLVGVGLHLKEERAGRALSLGEGCLCVARRHGGDPRTGCVGFFLAGLNGAGAEKSEVWAHPSASQARDGRRPGGEG